MSSSINLPAKTNKMIVKSVEYQVLYRKVREKFVMEVHGGKPANCGIDSPVVWLKKNENKEYYSVTFFGGSRAADPKYLYRKSSELRPESKPSGKIDDLTLLKALQYIGVNPPNDVAGYSKLKVPKQVEILMEVFRKDYSEDIQNENENSTTTINSVVEATYPEVQNSNLTAAKYAVQRFYENIASANFQEAWNLMSPELQKRRPWLGDFDRFRKGYTNTNTLRNIVVFNINQTVPNVIDCRVFYDDEIAAFTTKELSALDTLTVDDIDIFATQVKKLLKDFESKGLNGFENIELHKLFEPSASEYIWYKSGYDPDKLHELFPVQKAIVVKRVYDCSCGYFGDKWLINSINAMKTYSAR